MANLREAAKKPDIFTPGHRLCAGCGAGTIMRQVTHAVDLPLVVSCATGCVEVSSVLYPYSAWRCSFLHNAFENSAATMSGVETAYHALRKRGKLKDEFRFIAFGGDGGSYDIGLQSLSGAMERGHRMLYICVPPETELILNDGNIVKIGDFAGAFIKNKKEVEACISVDDSSRIGSILPVTGCAELFATQEFASAPARGMTLSWDGRSFKPHQISRVQRKKAPGELIKITTASGASLTMTAEHEVLVDTLQGPVLRQTCELNVKDELYSPRKIELTTAIVPYLLDLLDDDLRIVISEETRKIINSYLQKRFASVREASRRLGFKIWQFKERGRTIELTALKKIYRAVDDLSWSELCREVKIVCGGRGSLRTEFSASQLNEDIMYLLGLIASDGHIPTRRYSVVFVNKDRGLIAEFKNHYLRVFPNGWISEHIDKGGVYKVTVNNPVLFSIAKKLQVKIDPREILKLKEPLIAAFLRGYFDGDGHCSILKNTHSRNAVIILSTTSATLAKRLRILLKRLGVACFQDARKYRFDLTISSRQDISAFIKYVGSCHPKKIKAMEDVSAFLNSSIGRGRYFSIAPQQCGKSLMDIIKRVGIAVTSIDKKRNLYALASGRRRATKAQIRRYVAAINKFAQNDPALKRLELMLSENFFLDPIMKVERVSPSAEYVYDVTIETTHLFVPEAAFVISNCYDNEAYMNTGVQRSSATPKGTATTTSPAGTVMRGKKEFQKDLTGIMIAHNIPYAAQAAPSHWNDLMTKVQKALAIDGPAFMNVISPCPLGWRHSSEVSIELSRLAVDTCFWPLFEVENGAWKLTYKPKEKKPLVDWLKPQGRFRHLFEPQNKDILDDLQAMVDKKWEAVLKRCGEPSAPSA